MTNKTEQVTGVNVENEIQSEEDKSKVLDLQTLAEISGGVSGETPADWSTVSSGCNNNQD
jgi:hypothetical protein